MTKLSVLSIALILPLLLLSTALALPNDEKVRLIAHTTSNLDKISFKLKGCEVTHELKDATSIACPKNITIPNSEPDTVLHVLDSTSDHQINADQVWSLGFNGTGTTVAVLDTGIDYNNVQLISSSGSNDPVNGHCFAVAAGDCGNGFFDDMGHGTHVSGIITSDGITAPNNGVFSKGVAPGARIWMAKVCDASGNCQDSDIAAAIQYIVNNNISKVMSMSFGGGGTSSSNCDGDYLASQINWAYSMGVVSVVAAGNNGNNIVSSPACASDAIAVAAVDSSDNLASFSNYGNALQDHGVAAPGVGIYSTVPTGGCSFCFPTGYRLLSGTSMATPHVSATVALMLQKNSSLAPADIRSIIFSSANCLNNKYGACPNTNIGHGRVDALAATTNTPSVILSSGAPNITSFAPPSPVNDTAGSSRTFNITVNQTVNVTWYINGTLKQTNTSAPADILVNYTNTSAVGGFWNVTAIAQNVNGTASHTWLWGIAPLPRVLTSITVSPSSSTVTAGGTQSFNATSLNGTTPMSGVNISWTSSNTTVGTVTPLFAVTDVNGNASVTFTASRAGIAFVNATNGSVSGAASVTVAPGSDVKGFDTGTGSYPSIMGTHNGTLTLNQSINVNKMYTYPSPGTGGHSEYVRIWNLTWNTTATWSGYIGDWSNVTFSQPFTLEANITYNYTITTGSYPQIIHHNSISNNIGTITSTEFIDANGRHYSVWIPAIRLE